MSVELGLLAMVGTILLAVAFLGVLLYLIPVQPWIAAWSSGAPVGLLTLVAMRLRRVRPGCGPASPATSRGLSVRR
jgi:uncharacterized protein YqfA (UPF0365 family)